MYISNVDTQNYPFHRLQLVVEIRLGTQISEQTNKNSIKVPKIVNSQRIRKRNYKNLGTCVINSLMSPPSLVPNGFLWHFEYFDLPLAI